MSSIFVLSINIDALSLTCYPAYSCNSEIQSVNQHVYCYGHYSCLNATVSTNGSLIACYGSHSCIDASLSMASSGTHTICDGLFSCGGASIIHNSSTQSTYCRGEGACINSSIIMNTNASNLYCDGFRSCINATIYGKRNFYFWGAWSGADATIYTTLNNEQSLQFSGVYAGYGATIYCKENTTCNIYCYGTGCINTKASCTSGNSSDCTINVQCNAGVRKSDLCPDGDNSSLSLPPDVSSFGIFSNEENSARICEENSVSGSGSDLDPIVCDDFAECQFSKHLDTSNINSEHYNNPICCAGAVSCGSVSNITSKIELDTVDNPSNVAVRCDGSFTCFGIPGMVQTMTNGGDLYFTAVYSVWGYNTHTVISGWGQVDQGIVEYNRNESKTDFYCTALFSVTGATLTNGNNLFAVGRSSVWQSNVTNFNNVYCHGRSACDQTYFENINQVYCGGYLGCYYSEWEDIDQVFSYGYLASQFNDFTNINDYVFGFGQYSLYGANISASTIDNNKVKTLECRGAFCTRYSTISNFNVVIGIGSYSLYETTLNSISDEVNAIGDYAFRYSNLSNNEIDFDNTNSQVCI